VYFDGSNTTNRILDVLQEKRPKIVCIDELDKMARQFQEKLLNFMESGHIKVDQMRKKCDFDNQDYHTSSRTLALLLHSEEFQDRQ
jgi:MoxR-like ATPase